MPAIAALRALDVDGVPTRGAVGLCQAEVAWLQCTRTISCAGDERHVCRRGDRKTALPAHPGVAAGGRLDQPGGLPSLTAVGTELDALDPTISGIRDAGYPLEPSL